MLTGSKWFPPRIALVVPLLLAGLAPTAGSQTPATQRLLFYGAEKEQYLGAGVLGCEDRDGDGVRDLIAYSRVQQGGSAGPFVALYSGRTGTRIQDFRHEWLKGDILVLYGVGDLDADGFTEFAVRNRHDGELRLYDGKTWKLRYLWPGSTTTDWVAAPLGDVNGDGHPEFLLSGPGLSTQIGGVPRHGRVQVLSGKDLSLLQEQWGDRSGYFGEVVGALGDVDADGMVDYGVQDTDVNNTRRGSLFLYSGRDGKLLWEEQAPSFGSTSFADSFTSPGDVNGDGHADIVILDRDAVQNSQRLALMYVISGKDRTLLWHYTTAFFYSNHGWGIGRVSDWNGDGVDDLIGRFEGRLAVLSGKDGKLIREWLTLMSPSEGFSYDVVGDIDGDQRDDYALGFSYRDDWPKTRSGCVIVIGSRAPQLLASRNDLQTSNPQKVRFDLDFGSPAAGAPYLLLGSASGIRPGIPIGGFTIPLQPDAYMLFLLAAPGALIPAQLGVLDSTGTANASFVLPSALAPVLGGWQLDHAAVVFDAQMGLKAVGNAAPLYLWR